MPTFYNFKQNGVVYSFDDIFVSADLFKNGNLFTWGENDNGRLGDGDNIGNVNKSTPVTTFAGGSTWRQISSGRYHTAAIKTDGTLWAWGNNDDGQLGTNDLTIRSTPVTTFAGGTNWKQVSAGRLHTAAIKTDGTLWTWGHNNTGQLGIRNTDAKLTPVTTFTGGTNWKQVDCGYNHTAAIKTDGTLWTWGNGNEGQLGKENYLTPSNSVSTPVTTFAGGTNWADTATGAAEELYTLSAGGYHTTAIKTDGTLWIWGHNSQTQLGTNDSSDRPTPVTTFAGGSTWKQVSNGERHTAAIKTDGTLWVWGFNNRPWWYGGVSGQGQLGTNDLSNRPTPVTTFAGGTDWKQVSAGRIHTAAIKTDGTLWTWGHNNTGQLGIRNTDTKLTPVTTFSGGTNWKQVSVGYNYTAAVKTDGTLWTWGLGNDGQLGKEIYTPPFNFVSTPVTTFAGGTNWADTATGVAEELYTLNSGRYNTSAIKTDGTLWLWGSNSSGQLGTNDTITRSTPVTTIVGGTDWKQISNGESHTAAIKTDGTLWVWGENDDGRLGDGNNIGNVIKSTPVTTFTGGTNWKQVSLGAYHTTAIKTDGTLWVWGYNSQGQLGANDTFARSTPVTTFTGGTNWKQVSAGREYTAAIKTDGTLWTWGRGDGGQLGKEIYTFQANSILTPVTTFAGGTNWADTATGVAEELYTLSSGTTSIISAIKTDGTLWIWGNNIFGQLGISNYDTKSTPVTTFAGGTDWKQISVEKYSTSAIKTDGTLWVWGYNSQGQLGINNNDNKPTPVTTFAGGTNWKQVSNGERHTTAIKTDGTLWVWGDNNYGQLGIRNIIRQSTPVTTFTGGTNWKQVSAGREYTAAIKTDGTLWTWGYGYSGQLGAQNYIIPSDSVVTPITTFAGGTNWADTATGAVEELYTLNTGEYHAAAIKTDGTLWLWGYNNGYLGTNGYDDKSTPVTTFAGGTNWKQINVGRYHTSAIKTDGTLWVWGYNGQGQLGANDTFQKNTPVTTFAGGTDWKQVSIQDRQTAAIKTDGTLWVWGDNQYGKLGTNDETDRYTPVTIFTGGTNWKQVSAGSDHTAAIKTDGTLWIWGRSGEGQLGKGIDPIAAYNTALTPVTTFSGGTNWADTATGVAEELYTLSAGTEHSVAIKTNGTLWTWGRGDGGELGTNDITDRSTPVTTFAGGTNWKQISSGSYHTAAIKTDGTLWVWGTNSNGQLGTNDLTIRSTPVTTFAGGTNWKQVSAGTLYHITAIKTDGTLWVWGYNNSGQLGVNDTTQRSTPVTTFTGGTNWKQVSNGERHTAAIKTDGTLWTWGNGNEGQLGKENYLTPSNSVSTPVTTFAGGTNWADTATGVAEELYTLSAGGYHTTAIKTDGTLWIWGWNAEGQLGINSSIAQSTPVTTFAGGTTWKQISTGYRHTSGIKTDGTLWVWGLATSGQLGNNNTTNRSTPVTTFAGGTDWKQAVLGNTHTAAIKTDGTLWLWGSNSNGRLGTNDTTNRVTPVTTFTGGTNWKQVSAGLSQTAAIKTDGTLWTWGRGSEGQLGRYSVGTGKITPVTTFAGGTNWADTATGAAEELYTLSAGRNHSIAIKTDGTLWAWGTGTSGQLGINTASNRSTPVTTFAGGINWKQISSGSAATAAVKTDGTLWVWGNSSTGGLGINIENSTKQTPVTTFAGGTNWKQVSTSIGYWTYTAAIKTDGTLWLWGENDFGRLGHNDPPIGNINIATPITTFAGGTNWKQVSVGSAHTAAIKTDGTLWMWGGNGSTYNSGFTGKLGIGDTSYKATPITTFAGGTNWSQVSTGYYFTSAIKTDGTLWVWGDNTYGQLGINNTGNRSTPITTFAGGTNWKQVDCGSFHTTAIKTDGTLWTWGRADQGQLAINDATNRSTPVTTFAGGTNWKQVSAGHDHTIALQDDGVNKLLYIWGADTNGKLGATSSSIDYVPNQTFQQTTDWKQVSSGGYYTSAIKTDGTLWVWGYGGNGQLGNNDTTNRSTPVTTFAGGTNWKQIDCGNIFATAIKTDGTLWTWGYNGNGRLGTNNTTTTSTPVTTFAGGTNWKQVSAGYSHVVALQDDGVNKRLYVWGNNDNTKLGINIIQIPSYIPNQTFHQTTDWKQVDCARYYTTAIKTDGTLWVWGYNGQGQLGISNYGNKSTPVTTFAGGTDWKQVSSAEYHTLAIKTDGTLWVWGLNNNGELGINDLINRFTPVTTFTGGTNWKQVSAGVNHNIALQDDGVNKRLYTWGYNNGRLGVNIIEIPNYIPNQTIQQTTDWNQVDCGSFHTTAIKTDGTLWVWGYNGDGQLGIRNYDDKSTPVTTFSGGTNWKQVSAGYSFTTAVKTDGTLWTWGYNGQGQLGTNDYDYKSIPVTTFAGGTNWKQVSAGYYNTIALQDDGVNKRLYTWGYINYGQLGVDYVVFPSYIPNQTIQQTTDWNQVDCGKDYTSAIKTDGTLWVWGYNGTGQLGISNYDDKSTPVTTFAGGTNWKQVSSGFYHTTAVKTNGTLWLWGYNFDGQLGTNDTNYRFTPVTTFSGGTNWKQVSAGLSNTVALQDDGVNKRLYVWGSNDSSQLGVNFIIFENYIPNQTFRQTTDWKQVDCGNDHTSAIKTDGTLWTWGNNGDGKLGINDGTSRSTPVTTFAGGTNWKQISSGYRNTTAVKTDGTLWIWGRGNNGQLANNKTSNSSTPVTTIIGGTNWKQVSTGGYHTVALQDDGVNKRIYTWGSNDNSQLGIESILFPSYIPNQTIQQTTDWKQVDCGTYHTTAIKTDGTLWVWGYNGNGHLGINNTNSKSTPVTTFAGGTNWKQVNSGGNFTTAVKTDGTLWVWGYNTQGQLGANNRSQTNTPVTTFTGGTNWKQVSAGYDYTIALQDDGVNKRLYTWGINSYSQLGVNFIEYPSYIPDQTFQQTIDWRQVSAGYYHTTAIKTDGSLWVWGNNGQGQLGTNNYDAKSTPVTTFTGGTNWRQVSAGNQYTAAIKTDGTLWTWGRGYEGQLGRFTDYNQTISDKLTPVTTFAGGTNWADTATGASEELYTLSAGYSQTAAIKTDGTLWTWGVNWSGYLGINDETGDPRFTPVTTFAGGTDWKQVALGYYSVTAGIKTDGTLWVWGYNGNGYLGNNSNNYSYAYTPVTTFAGGTNWKQVSAGQYPVAAIKTDGTLWTWGRGDGVVLGTNDEDNRSTPVTTFAGGTDWKQISCGDYHVAAIKTDGTLWLYGYNYNGYLGTNDTTNRSTPVTTFAGGTNWKQVSGGASYTAAIKTDGTLWTWGYNGYGQLGTNDYDDKSTPVTTIAGGTDWKQVSAGKGYPAQTAAIKTDGTLWTWGYNDRGQLGTNDNDFKLTPVTTFAGGTNWKQVNCGYRHTVALQDDGVNKKLYVFGSNEYNNLGATDPSIVFDISSQTIPDTIYSEGLWKQINTGYRHTSGIKTDGTLWIWGYNGQGRLGTNNTITKYTPVTTFAGGTNWKQVSIGSDFTVAITYEEPTI